MSDLNTSNETIGMIVPQRWSLLASYMVRMEESRFLRGVMRGEVSAGVKGEGWVMYILDGFRAFGIFEPLCTEQKGEKRGGFIPCSMNVAEKRGGKDKRKRQRERKREKE